MNITYTQGTVADIIEIDAAIPEFDNKNSKQKIEQQEVWVKNKGFKSIRVKSMNRFPAMLQLLISQGYVICGYDDKGSPE